MLELPKLRNTGRLYTTVSAEGTVTDVMYTLSWTVIYSSLPDEAHPLGEGIVREVTGATFAFPDSGDVATASHIAHLAETTVTDPLLFGGHDALIRERFRREIVVGMVRSYFWFLGEHLRPKNEAWHTLAGLLWNEPTGSRDEHHASIEALVKAYPQHAEALVAWLAKARRRG